MLRKNAVNILLFLLITALIIFLINFIFFKKKIEIIQPQSETDLKENEIYNSNIIENVNYITKDADGNEYLVNSEIGEIDYNNPNIIYLTNVTAVIKLKDSENVNIISDFGKYNTENFDTIFSKNVIIDYQENKITGEYLDFSPNRNSMIVSKNVIYTNLENILKADVIEIDLKTKDTKIYMYEDKKKVRVKSKN